MFRQTPTFAIAMMVALGAAIGLTAGFTLPVQGASAQKSTGKRSLLPFEVDATGKKSPIVMRYAVKNLETGKLTHAHEPYAPADPLGTQKVLYAGAALELLGPEFRFGTVFWAKGRVKDGILWGDLVVEGHGDPTVDDVRVAWIAGRLRQMGIERISHGIVLNDLYFLPTPPPAAPVAGPDGGPGIEVEPPKKKVVGAWSPTKALLYRNNKLDVAVYHRGSRAEVSLLPPMIGVAISHDVRSATFGHRLRAVEFGQPGTSPSLFVAGAVADRAEVNVQLEDSTFLFGHAIYTELRRRGVKVPYRFAVEKEADRYRWIMTDVSPPLTDLLSRYLHGELPEELFTKAVLRRIGHDHDEGRGLGTVAFGLDRVVDHLEDKIKIPRGSYKLDAAFKRSKLSSGQLVDLLDSIYGRFEVKSEFSRALGPARTHRQLVARGLSDDVLDIVRVNIDVADGRAAMCGYAQRPGGTPIAFAATFEGQGVTELVEAQNRFLEWLVHPKKTAGHMSLDEVRHDHAQHPPGSVPAVERRPG